jgi:hypothetical protein
MATEIYFTNVKTGTKFKVVGRDTKKGTVTLECEYGRFEEPYDKDWLVRNGYVVEKVETADG